MTIKTTLLASQGNATGIKIPEKNVEALGSGRKPKVKATINGYTYRTTVAYMGGEYWIPVVKAIREAAGVKAGDKLTLLLEPDNEPRTVEIPEILAQAFSANKNAKTAFDKLAYSHRKEHVRAINEAKKEETRIKRVEKAIEMLLKGKTGA